MRVGKTVKKITAIFLSVCMVVTMSPALMFSAGLGNPAYADSALFTIDGKNYTESEFIKWAENDARKSEAIHTGVMLRDWNYDGDTIEMKAKLDLDLDYNHIHGDHDDTFMEIGGGGNVIFRNGTIAYFGDSYSDGGAIRIEGNNAVLMLDDADLSINEADRGGGIYIDGNKNNVIMDHAMIDSNKVDDLGGGIYVEGDHNTIAGTNYSYITQNTETSSWGTAGDGGGIYLNDNDNVVSGLTIAQNKTPTDGGGIYVGDESNSIINCEITGNSAKYGGGIYMGAKNNTIDSCDIIGNKASSKGDGVFAIGYITRLTVKGKTRIYNNDGNGDLNNLYMENGNGNAQYPTELILSGLTAGSEVHISYYNAINYLTIGPGCDNSYVVCDNSRYKLVNDNGTMRMVDKDMEYAASIDGKKILPPTLERLLSEGLTGVHTIDMLDDWHFDSQILFCSGSNITVNMNGYMIERTDGDDGDSVIQVNSSEGAQTTINLNGGNSKRTHDIRFFKTEYPGDKDDMTVTGSVITGGYGDNDGGAINIDGDYCTLNVDNVDMIGNDADDCGGAIYVDDSNCTVNLNSCDITGNYADDDGGGIFLNDTDCKLTLTKSNVYRNRAQGDGGGIFIDENRTSITADESCINENYAGDDGGGIYTSTMYAETLFIKGKNDSEINYNTAAGGEGGGIYLGNDSIKVAGFEFRLNHAATNGGGIYSEEESITVTNCDFIYNQAGEHGGGIYVNNDKTSLNNINVTHNSAGISGSGIYVASDVDKGFTVSGNTVVANNDGNKASSNLYMSDSDGEDSHVGIEGLGAEADLHIGYYDPSNNLRVSEVPGTYDERKITCDNSGYYFNWDRDRHLYMRKGTNPDSKAKTSVQTGAAEKVGEYEGYDKLKGYMEHGDSLSDAHDTAVCFFYSDGYFDDGQDPVAYNEHLATTSLNFAMSAFNTSYGRDKDYRGKHEAGRQFLADIGCDDQTIYINDYYTKKPTTDSIGVIMGQKSLVMSNGTDTGNILIPIAVRGAGYEKEWASNVLLGDGTDGLNAKGFSTSADKVLAEVEKYIAKYELEDELEAGKVRFWVTGYSRGAAVANLVAKELVDEYAGTDTDNRVYAYTWATPLAAGGVNKEEYYCIHNCINYADMIPLVAPSNMGFIRYGVDHYVPGSQAGEVGRYVDDEHTSCVSDNTPYETTSSNYNAQKAQMLDNLNEVDSSKLFDDYFAAAYWSFTDLDFVEDKDNTTASAEKFQRDLINNLQTETTLASRTAYSNDVFTLGSKQYTTKEKAFAYMLEMYFGGEYSDEMDNMVDSIGTILDYIDITDTFEIIAAFDDLLGDWGTLSDSEKAEWIDDIWNMLDETGAFDEFTADQRAELADNLPVLIDLMLNFADPDYSAQNRYGIEDERLIMLGTTINNMGRLITNHYAETNLSWARSFDSFYNTEEEEYEIAKPTEISAPSATLEVKDEEGEISYEEMSTDKTNVLKGNSRIILDVAGSSGEAIYYTVKNKTAGTTAEETIYRGGIDLSLMNQGSTEYEVTATAMQYNASSKPVTYTFKVEDARHKVAVGDTEYFYEENNRISVSPQIPEGKIFDHWKIEIGNVNGDSTQRMDLTKADNLWIAAILFGKETITAEEMETLADTRTLSVRMPVTGSGTGMLDIAFKQYELIFTPVYADKISTLEVSDIGGSFKLEFEPYAPKAECALPRKLILTGNSGQTSEKQIKTVDLQWSYEYNHQDVITSNPAYNNTVYKARVTVSADEAERICFTDNFSSVTIADKEYLEGVTVSDIERNFTDGSVSFTLTFPETEEGNNKPPEDDRILLVSAFDLNMNDFDGDAKPYRVVAGNNITLTAPSKENFQFSGWDRTASEIDISEAMAGSRTITISIPNDEEKPSGFAYNLQANYVPLIQGFNVQLGDSESVVPVAGEPLPSLESMVVRISNYYGISKDNIELTWAPEEPASGKAAYDTTYTAIITLKPETSGEHEGWINLDTINGSATEEETWARGIFLYGETVTARVNGRDANLDRENNSIYYTFPATEVQKFSLVSVSQPSDLEKLPYGTSETALMEMLPETVQITYESKGADKTVFEAPASVSWKNTLCEGSGLEPKTYEFTGTVELPENIENDKTGEESVSLEVSIKADVLGAPYAPQPTATVNSGTFHSSFTVCLTGQEGCDIYYTLDGTTPTSDSQKYTGPITIKRTDGTAASGEDEDIASTVQLKAVAVKDGFRDSLVSSYGYSFDSHVFIPAGTDEVYDGAEHIGVAGEPGTYTLSIEKEDGEQSENGYGIDENGNAYASAVGTYTVTASLEKGYEWITGTEEVDGKVQDITTTEDQVITFKIADNIDFIVEDINGILSDIEEDVLLMEALWGEDEFLKEGIVEVYSDELNSLTLRAGDLSGQPVTAELIRQAKKTLADAQTLKATADGIIGKAEGIDSLNTLLLQQEERLNALEISMATSTTGVKAQLYEIKSTLSSLSLDNRQLVKEIACFQDKVQELQNRVGLLSNSLNRLQSLSVDTSGSVRFFGIGAEFERAKAIATFGAGVTAATSEVTGKAVYTGFNSQVSDNEKQTVTVYFTDLTDTTNTRICSYDVYVGDYYAVGEFSGGDISSEYKLEGESPALTAHFDEGDTVNIRGAAGLASSTDLGWSELTSASTMDALDEASGDAIGVGASGIYTLKVVIVGEGEEESLGLEMRLTAPDVAGNVEIAGDAVYGETLSAQVTDGISGQKGSFSWFRDGEEITGENSAEYTIGAEDLGKKLSVCYTGEDGYGGTLTSEETEAVAPRTVTVSGITALDKDYDGTSAAVLSFDEAVISGLVDGDDIEARGDGAFADINAGKNRTVQISDLSLSGRDAGCYQLDAAGSQQTANATIFKISPALSVSLGAEKVVNGQRTYQLEVSRLGDGKISFTSNADIASVDDKGLVTVNAAGMAIIAVSVAESANYTSAATTANIFVLPIKNAALKVKLSTASYVYNGNVKKPKVSKVYDASGKVVDPEYYAVSYSNSKSRKIGKYTVTVTMKAPYTGKYTATYRINPRSKAISRITKGTAAKSGKCTLTVKWRKATTVQKKNITGFQIRYSKDRNFKKGVKIKTVKSNKAYSAKLTKLAKGKKYYVQLRTYKTVKGVRYYSKWSKKKAQKTR